MATLIEEREEESNEEEVGDVNKIAEDTPKEGDTPEAAVEGALPEKYRGKSLPEVVRMHQEAERVLGKQGTEVGELRRVVDDFISSHNSSESKNESVEEVDFFTDPEAAIDKKIENHPLVKKAAEDSRRYQKSTAMTELERRHPEMKATLKDDKFSAWVQGSNYRLRLFSKADSEYDYEAADELFSAWEDRKALVGETVSTEKAQRSSAVKQASTGTTRGSGAQGNRKIYRRADIIKLMQTDPDRYEALEPEIRQAYAEGRVK
jgi:cell fate (sporulation/competence/biofilm development) regulator YmcA (YheA/YmcA/DUF963 family)